LTTSSKLTIINQRELQNKFIEGSVIPIATIKMGMTIEEAAECSGIGRNTMRKLVEWKKIPVLKVGRKAIIRSDTLDRFMAANQGRNLLVRDDVRSVE
jgi:excisionase family DNA binding protein